MAESPRIQELKRRVQVDPASIAFAALAEEYRRAGRYEEAIATCQSGLQRHPAYLSARVTLGRALLELSRFDEAREELEHVLRAAPENLAAIRGLAEIHHRRGELPEALEQYRTALNVAKHDAELEDTVNQFSKRVAPREQSDPVPAVPAPASVPDRVSAQHPDPAHRGGDSPGRPHLELVTRQPRTHEPEPEPEPSISARGSESFAVRDAVNDFPEESDPGETRPHADDELQSAETEAESSREEDPEIAAPEAEPSPIPLISAAEAETIVTAPLVVPVPPAEPALVALEGFLGAILREKEHLSSPPSARR